MTVYHQGHTSSVLWQKLQMARGTLTGGRSTLVCMTAWLCLVSLRVVKTLYSEQFSNAYWHKHFMCNSVHILVIHEDCLLVCTGSSCSVHLINEGVVVNGHEVTVQFLGGSSVQSYLCKIGDSNFHPCEWHQCQFVLSTTIKLTVVHAVIIIPDLNATIMKSC